MTCTDENLSILVYSSRSTPANMRNGMFTAMGNGVPAAMRNGMYAVVRNDMFAAMRNDLFAVARRGISAVIRNGMFFFFFFSPVSRSLPWSSSRVAIDIWMVH